MLDNSVTYKLEVLVLKFLASKRIGVYSNDIAKLVPGVGGDI
jgi:hypothetical protein